MDEILTKEQFFKVLYEELSITNFVDTEYTDWYIRFEDILKIINDEYFYSIYGLMDVINNYYNERIELFTYNTLERNKIYAKIYPDIKIYKDINGKYYTLEKTNIKNIDKLFEMKSLTSYIDNELFETLNYSLDNKSFAEKFSKTFDINLKFFKQTSNHTDKFSQIELYKYKYKFSDKNIELAKSFCNLFGYTFIEEENRYVFTPYHGEDCSSLVYNSNNDIVYHLTSKYFYDKIKNKNGYIPMRSDFGWEGKDRLYVFCGDITKDNNVMGDIPSFKRLSIMIAKAKGKHFPEYYDKNLLLKIDLSKNDKDLNFFYDPAFKTQNMIPMYTHNDILIDCIVDTFKVTDSKIVL